MRLSSFLELKIKDLYIYTNEYICMFIMVGMIQIN